MKIVPKRGDFGTIEKFLYIRELKNYNVDEKRKLDFPSYLDVCCLLTVVQYYAIIFYHERTKLHKPREEGGTEDDD